MHKLIYVLFKSTTYLYYRIKYPEAKDLKLNGYFIKISGEGRLVVGKRSYISFFSKIYITKQSTVRIGNDVSIAHNVSIYTSTRNLRVFCEKGQYITRYGDVIIGNKVFIGNNCYIGPGVKIVDGVVIGANTVVHEDITEPGVYAGNPIRKVK
jgi:acetyltransferase-like isoleucine patch superfamily enzyme